MELLERERSIVVVVDLQGKLMDVIERPSLVIAATVRLMKLAGMFEIPVILTEQYPRGIGPTHPTVRDAFDALTTPKRFVEKTSFGCCGVGPFDAALEELRPGVPAARRQVAIAGIEAHVCVMQTAIELLREGTQVFICWDCVSSRGAEYRRHALDRMLQAGAILTNHESAGFEWARDKNHPRFREMSNLFKEGQLNG